jgi:peptidoglycan/xylan/chitin deacetylase (PgdA/CDA1 family)
VSQRAHLIIPYQLDTNDARYAMLPGWNSGEDFFHYLKASFECLHREGAQSPKMMTIGLHARFSGRPGRCEALYRFIKYVVQFDDVWICRREDIANHWYVHAPVTIKEDCDAPIFDQKNAGNRSSNGCELGSE